MRQHPNLADIEGDVADKIDSSSDNTIDIPNEEAEQYGVENLCTEERSKFEQVVPDFIVDLLIIQFVRKKIENHQLILLYKESSFLLSVYFPRYPNICHYNS